MKIQPFRDADRWLRTSKLPSKLRAIAQAMLKEAHARANGMSREKADELNSLMCMRSFSRLGFHDKNQPPLPPEATLQDYITASRIVKEMCVTINSDGSSTHRVHMADRGLAAFYAEENFGGPENLLEILGYSLTLCDDDE